MLTLQPPSVLTEVISETPAIWPSRRSSGVASEDATVAGLAPGSDAETVTIGKSTRGIGATGMKRYATTPLRNNPSASSDVPTGRRMNGSEMFMRRFKLDHWSRIGGVNRFQKGARLCAEHQPQHVRISKCFEF